MSVNNEDRVSSAKLKEVFDKLWDDRYLGKEPEVETETVEYPAHVYPTAGTYTYDSQGLQDMGTATGFDIDHNLPIKVFGAISKEDNSFIVPEKSGEPLAILDVVSTASGLTVISDIEITDEMINNQPITGHYFVMKQGEYYFCFYEMADMTNFNTAHVWETTASSEDVVTKTKHTVKQDFLPNADWNVNDPNADGYVQGRTHWVEEGTGTVSRTYNQSQIEVEGEVVGFDYPTGGYHPTVSNDYIDLSEVFGAPMMYYASGIDANGAQIHATNYNELVSFMSTVNTGYMGSVTESENPFCMLFYPNAANGDNITITYAGEIIHKLPNKFIDREALNIPDEVEVPTDLLTKSNSLNFYTPNSDYISDTSDYYYGKNYLGHGIGKFNHLRSMSVKILGRVFSEDKTVIIPTNVVCTESTFAYWHLSCIEMLRNLLIDPNRFDKLVDALETVKGGTGYPYAEIGSRKFYFNPPSAFQPKPSSNNPNYYELETKKSSFNDGTVAGQKLRIYTKNIKGNIRIVISYYDENGTIISFDDAETNADYSVSGEFYVRYNPPKLLWTDSLYNFYNGDRYQKYELPINLITTGVRWNKFIIELIGYENKNYKLSQYTTWQLPEPTAVKLKISMSYSTSNNVNLDSNGEYLWMNINKDLFEALVKLDKYRPLAMGGTTQNSNSDGGFSFMSDMIEDKDGKNYRIVIDYGVSNSDNVTVKIIGEANDTLLLKPYIETISYKTAKQ